MAWGTDFTTDIYLDRQVYKSVGEVEYAIENIDANIEQKEASLRMLASSSPRDITPAEWDDSPIGWLYHETTELLNALKEDAVERYKLVLYAEFLKDKDGQMG